MNLFGKKEIDEKFDIDIWKLHHPLFTYRMPQEDLLNVENFNREKELIYLEQAIKDLGNLLADVQVSYDATFIHMVSHLLHKRHLELK